MQTVCEQSEADAQQKAAVSKYCLSNMTSLFVFSCQVVSWSVGAKQSYDKDVLLHR